MPCIWLSAPTARWATYDKGKTFNGLWTLWFPLSQKLQYLDWEPVHMERRLGHYPLSSWSRDPSSWPNLLSSNIGTAVSASHHDVKKNTFVLVNHAWFAQVMQSEYNHIKYRIKKKTFDKLLCLTWSKSYKISGMVQSSFSVNLMVQFTFGSGQSCLWICSQRGNKPMRCHGVKWSTCCHHNMVMARLSFHRGWYLRTSCQCMHCSYVPFAQRREGLQWRWGGKKKQVTAEEEAGFEQWLRSSL